MVSSKGKPTDPKLREQVKNKVKNESNKDGSGKGQWSAWKATKLSKEYEKEGGGYENEAGSKNEPKKGAPKPKTEDKKSKETKSTKDTKDAKEKKSTASASQKKAAGAAGKKKSGDPKKAAAAKSSKSAAAKKGTKAKKP